MHSWKEIDRKFNIWTIATDTWADSVFAQRAGTTVGQVVLHRQTRTICAAGGSAIYLHLDMPLALLYQWMLPWTLISFFAALFPFLRVMLPRSMVAFRARSTGRSSPAGVKGHGDDSVCV